MNQDTQTRVTPFTAVLFRLLNYIEIISVVIATVGFAMLYVGMEGAPQMLTVSLSLLAAVFFMRAHQPIDGPASQVKNENDRPTGMFGLLGSTIAPKVLGIGSAVMVTGILFWILDMKGAMEMLMIGSTVLTIALVLVGIFILTKPAWGAALMPLLYRAVPVWIVGVYLFLSTR